MVEMIIKFFHSEQAPCNSRTHKSCQQKVRCDELWIICQMLQVKTSETASVMFLLQKSFLTLNGKQSDKVIWEGFVNMFMISINHFVAHSFISGSDLDSTAIGLHTKHCSRVEQVYIAINTLLLSQFYSFCN